jgi:alkylation response protein AidB-like acyl-CoA dehydrogenase
MSLPIAAETADRQEERALLRASAAAFVGRESPTSRARALRGKAPGFDLRFWAAMAQQGWTGLLAPESAGGYDQGLAEMAEVVSALTEQAAPEPMTPVVVFAGRLLAGCGDNGMAASLLEQMASGQLLPAVAWQEDATGSAATDRAAGLAEPATVCAAHPSGLRLSGCKLHVRPGAAAGGYVVTASSSEGLALVWLPAESAGLTRQLQRLADGSFAAGLDIAGAVVPASHLLASGTKAHAAFAAAHDETLVMAGVELLACARRMLAMTLDFLRTRQQFGKPIGSFQGLQHRAVDLLIQQELSSALVGHALSEFDRGLVGRERAQLAARVKARCSHAALTIARESVQMHGAIGVTDEHDLGLYLQRTLVLSAWLGNASQQRRRVAALSRRDASGTEADAR